MLLAERLELVLAVDVLPNTLHVVPVSHDAVLHRVTDGQEPAVLLGLGPDEQVSLQGSCHDPGVFRPPDEVGKVALGDLVAGESGFDDAGPIVDDDRLVDDQIVLFHDGTRFESQQLLNLNTHSKISALGWMVSKSRTRMLPTELPLLKLMTILTVNRSLNKMIKDQRGFFKFEEEADLKILT